MDFICLIIVIITAALVGIMSEHKRIQSFYILYFICITSSSFQFLFHFFSLLVKKYFSIYLMSPLAMNSGCMCLNSGAVADECYMIINVYTGK